MNRVLAPEFSTISNVDFAQAQTEYLSNKLPLHIINAGSQELVKIEFNFYAGTIFQQKPLVASSANRLLKEGTSKYTAMQIAETMDFYGAFLENENGHDVSSLTLYALNKHLPNLLPMFHDIIFDAAFPENEFETYRTNALQKYYTRQKKVSEVAAQHFGEMIYGNDNFYGYAVNENDYKNLAIDDIKSFYRERYCLENATVIISGKVDTGVKNLMQESFGTTDFKGINEFNAQLINNSISENKKYVVIDDALQSAIRIGRKTFTKTHQDFLPMLVLNTILGGYFGSRLMANIREDKGYTYGIGSGISAKILEGHFFISTEVGADVTHLALTEIYKEIEILRTQLVADDELQLVKNYMMGTFLRSIDGAFALAQKFSGIYFYDLSYDYYQQYFKTITEITPQNIMDLANKYLHEKDLVELVVGKMN